MKTPLSRIRFALTTAGASLLAACVYVPAPVIQTSYPFAQHPGVAVEVVQQYDVNGIGYRTSSLVNRSGMDKCAWTDTLPSRLLRAGETWSLGVAPVNAGVANVQPGDPGCVNAKRAAGVPAR